MGQIFANLTRQGIASPNGQTQYYNSPLQGAQALAATSAKTAQPGTSSVNGTIADPTITSTQVGNPPEGGVGPMQAPDVTVSPGQDQTTVTQNAPPIAPQPGKMVRPTFQEANAGGPLSPALSNKGKLLSLLLEGGIGAAIGDAAARQGSPRYGYPGASAGFAAGMNVLPAQAEIRNRLAQEQLEQEKEKAQIAALPGTLQQERDLRASEIAKNHPITQGTYMRHMEGDRR